jgi:poly(3-hydroxyalkanoate) synthetase
MDLTNTRNSFKGCTIRNLFKPLLMLKDGCMTHCQFQALSTDRLIRDCYKNNLLVSRRMRVSGNAARARGGSSQQSTIVAAADLSKITMPVLTIIAEKDDLVSPASSLAINDHISSKGKSVLQNLGGHAALCISGTAHKKLWPDVAKWLFSR